MDRRISDSRNQREVIVRFTLEADQRQRKSIKTVFVICHRRSDHQAHDFLLNLRFSEDERQKMSSLRLCFNDLELFSRCSALVVCLRPCRVSTFFRYGPFPETTIQLRSTITQPSTSFFDSFGTAPASSSVFSHTSCWAWANDSAEQFKFHLPQPEKRAKSNFHPTQCGVCLIAARTLKTLLALNPARDSFNWFRLFWQSFSHITNSILRIDLITICAPFESSRLKRFAYSFVWKRQWTALSRIMNQIRWARDLTNDHGTLIKRQAFAIVSTNCIPCPSQVEFMACHWGTLWGLTAHHNPQRQLIEKLINSSPPTSTFLLNPQSTLNLSPVEANFYAELGHKFLSLLCTKQTEARREA